MLTTLLSWVVIGVFLKRASRVSALLVYFTLLPVLIFSDSRAIVSTSGLLGGKYIRINPGAADDNLQENGKIKFTQSSINIEDLIGKLMYSLTSKAN